jgi:hypothetical protein
MRKSLVWVPLLAAVVATALFFAQGGFGAGHGDFDAVIWILGVPGILLTAPGPVASHDLLRLIWWPAVWNAVLWTLLGMGMTRLYRVERPQRT